ncbi:hypothetical protein [Pseudoalteromonas rubra]|uniref:Phage abortive infection protein n=1 Tax=Pseudoalteromonas rubra TaxID=43658 RepID=A0A0U3HM09_9GAMM|nr:hypothetical protein [Pseudoalteromonas rubra]ALU41944.1 hypothetical protein AT705_02760 [Pseudoalteromonas rubra]
MIDTEMLFTLVALVLMWPALYVVVRVIANVHSVVANAHTRLRNKVNKCLSKEAQKVVAILFFGLAFTLLLMYIFGFFDKSLAHSIELATIAINNFITPTLLALSVFLLYKTWSTSKEDLKETKDILRKKEELDLLRSRIQLLNKTLDATPSDYLDFKSDLMVLNINSETNGIDFWNDLRPLLDRTKRLLSNEESLFIFDDARIFTALKAINTSLGSNAPTYRDIFSTPIKREPAVYMRLMRSGLEERTDEEIKRILSNLVRLLYKETYFAECRDNKDYEVEIAPIKHQDMLVKEMAISIIQLVKNSKYEGELFNEYRFHFSSLEFAGLQELTNFNSL